MNKGYFKLIKNRKEVVSFVTDRTNNFSFGNKNQYSGFNIALHVGDDYDNVLKNRLYLANEIGYSLSDFIYMNQVHGGNVIPVSLKDKGSGTKTLDDAILTDSIITNDPGIVLVVMVADCLPVLFYDYINNVIGVAHAGWRGTSKNIVSNVIDKMKIEYNSNPSNIILCFGPSISQKSFEVGYDFIINFDSKFYSKSSNGKYFLDLRSVNKQQAIDSGVLEKNIEISKEDTLINEKYFSARRLGIKSGRFGLGICLI